MRKSINRKYNSLTKSYVYLCLCFREFNKTVRFVLFIMSIGCAITLSHYINMKLADDITCWSFLLKEYLFLSRDPISRGEHIEISLPFSFVFHMSFTLVLLFFRYRCCISSLSSTMLNVQGSPWPDEQRTETHLWLHGRRRRCSRNGQTDWSPIFPKKATYRNALIGMGILYYHQPAKYLAESSSTEYRPCDKEKSSSTEY